MGSWLNDFPIHLDRLLEGLVFLCHRFVFELIITFVTPSLNERGKKMIILIRLVPKFILQVQLGRSHEPA